MCVLQCCLGLAPRLLYLYSVNNALLPLVGTCGVRPPELGVVRATSESHTCRRMRGAPRAHFPGVPRAPSAQRAGLRGPRRTAQSQQYALAAVQEIGNRHHGVELTFASSIPSLDVQGHAAEARLDVRCTIFTLAPACAANDAAEWRSSSGVRCEAPAAAAAVRNQEFDLCLRAFASCSRRLGWERPRREGARLRIWAGSISR